MSPRGLTPYSPEENRLRVLLRDYGFHLRPDGKLVEEAVAWVPAKVHPFTFWSVREAVEHLIPLVADDEFTARAMRRMGE